MAIGSYLPYTRRINVPVLIANGQKDGLFCGGPLGTNCSSDAALRNDEAPYFSPSAQLETYTLPNAGHCISLALNTTPYQNRVVDWLAQRTTRS